MANKEEPIDAEFTQTKELAQRTEPPAPALFDGDQQSYRQQIVTRRENHQSLIDEVLIALDPSVDLIRVHFVKKDKCEHFGPPRCTYALAPWHWSEMDLSKRGAEKINGLLGLSTRFPGMRQYMHSAASGVKITDIMLTCELMNWKGVVISDGVGGCSLKEMYGDINKALKFAAKRAHIDAIKRCGGLSGLATEINKRFANQNKTTEQAIRDANIETSRSDGDNKWAQGVVYEKCPIGNEIKGKYWYEIESKALQWIVDRVKGKPDVTKAAAKELAKRK